MSVDEGSHGRVTCQPLSHDHAEFHDDDCLLVMTDDRLARDYGKVLLIVPELHLQG